MQGKRRTLQRRRTIQMEGERKKWCGNELLTSFAPLSGRGAKLFTCTHTHTQSRAFCTQRFLAQAASVCSFIAPLEAP